MTPKNGVVLTVLSMVAASAGRTDCYWHGILPLAPVTATFGSDDDKNEAIFRILNRVTDADVALLEDLGYNLPSLSTGDVLVWGGKAWRVDSIGFSPVTLSGLLFAND